MLTRLRRLASISLGCSFLVAGCGGVHVGGAPDALTLAARVRISTTSTIPVDGQCTHITATRLSDFQVSSYQGLLAGAAMQALVGDARVTATAYPQPCAQEPTQAPWIADAQIATFNEGDNVLTLDFHQNVNVTVNPTFDNNPAPLVVDQGPIRTGRNGEDAAGPNFSLDGWELKQIPVPPATGSETVLFTTEGKGPPYSPRGVAHFPSGGFVFQVGETTAPLYAFDGMGNALGARAVSYASGLVAWDYTDGLDAIDDTHLVRTAFANTGIGCDATGANCTHSGLDILTQQTASDGSITYSVTSQLLLRSTAAEDLANEYIVGVTSLPGGKFAATALPNDNSGTSHLVILNSDGTIAAGPTIINGDVEGLFDDGAGRIIALDYNGLLTTYSDTTAAVQAATASFAEGVSVGAIDIAWRGKSGNFMVVTQNNQFDYATAAFDSVTPVGISLSGYTQVSGLAYRPDLDQVGLMDRYGSGVVNFYELTGNTQVSTVALQTGLVAPYQMGALAWVAPTQQLITHAHRNVADATLDAVAFVFNLDGSLASKIDLTPLGFRTIQSLAYDAVADRLLFLAYDTAGTLRIVATNRSGTPERSYTVEAVPNINGMGPMDSGDIGIVEGQPSFFARVALPQ